MAERVTLITGASSGIGLELARIFAANGHHRAIVAVHGGSGVGKSEIGSVLGEMLRRDGIGAYVMSGDNYPRRIPAANDAERLRRFRTGGVQGLAASGVFGDEVRDQGLVGFRGGGAKREADFG